MSARSKVLVAEKIGDSGIELLRQDFEVDLGVGWTPEELADRIGDYDGILIRSATKLDRGPVCVPEDLIVLKTKF